MKGKPKGLEHENRNDGGMYRARHGLMGLRLLHSYRNTSHRPKGRALFFKPVFTWVLLLFLVFFAGTGWAFLSPDMPKDLEKLKESGQLRIAVLKLDVPPFVFERNGSLFGADIDMARDMAANLGVKAVFVRIEGGYEALVQAVAEKKADIGICELSKTLKRAQIVFFSRPYMVSGFTLFANRLSVAGARKQRRKSSSRQFDLRAAFNNPGITISTMSGSATVEMMDDLFPRARKLTTGSWGESARDVYSGRVDAAILPNSAYQALVHEMPALKYKAEADSLNIDDPLAIAVNPGLPDLLRWINDYLDVTNEKRQASLAELVRRYMGEPATAPPSQPLPKEVSPPGQKLQTGPNWWVIIAGHVAALILFGLLVVRRGGPRQWLLSPWTVLGGMVLGGVTGYLNPSLAAYFGPPAEIYMNFWELCVLPIMITTVVTSIYRLLAGGKNARLVKRLLLIIPVTLILLATLGFLAGIWGSPGADFPQEAQRLLSQNLSAGSRTMERQSVFEQVMQMARNIIPDNPLKPVVENQSLAVLFIAMFFGIMLTRCKIDQRETVVMALDAVLEAFTGMVLVSLYMLPLALYALALDFTARMGLELLGAIFRLAACMTLALLFPLAFSVLALWSRLKVSFKAILKEFGPMFLVAFSARSSVIAMPLGLEALKKYRNINHDQAMAAFPLSLLICHSGMAIFYSLTPVFIGQVFQVEFSFGQHVFIVLGAVLSSVASIGTIGLSYVMLLSIVCGPLGLPLEPAVMVGMALMAILDPVISSVQALFGCGITIVLIDKESG